MILTKLSRNPVPFNILLWSVAWSSTATMENKVELLVSFINKFLSFYHIIQWFKIKLILETIATRKQLNLELRWSFSLASSFLFVSDFTILNRVCSIFLMWSLNHIYINDFIYTLWVSHLTRNKLKFGIIMSIWLICWMIDK